MNRRLTQVLICQLATFAFSMAFVADVRDGYRAALLRQGGEIERHDIVEELHAAGVNLPDNFRTFPDKDTLISPGLIELEQNFWYLIPAALLQCLAIVLAIVARTQNRVIGDEEAQSMVPGHSDDQNKAQRAGSGQPATRSELDSEGSDKSQPESEGRSRYRVPGLDVL